MGRLRRLRPKARTALVAALGVGALLAATVPGLPAPAGGAVAVAGALPEALSYGDDASPAPRSGTSLLSRDSRRLAPEPLLPPALTARPGLVLGAHPSAANRTAGARVMPGPTGTLGIPVVAIRAYQRAAARLALDQPGCGLEWTLLAGIGRIESGHARGGRVDVNGRTGTPIVGPVLDGTNGNAAIRDTEGGRLDGDRVWDRAVGPMQFIPTSWARWGADASGDGVADPANLNDATLAAGRYLCANGGDLRDDAAARAAVFTYNHSTAYVDEVLAWADAYATGVRPVASPPVPPGPAGPPPAPTGEPDQLLPAAPPPVGVVVPTTPPVTSAPVTPAPVTTDPVTPPPSTTPPVTTTAPPSSTPPPGPSTEPPAPTTDPPAPTTDPPAPTPTCVPTTPPATDPTSVSATASATTPATGSAAESTSTAAESASASATSTPVLPPCGS